MESKSIVRGCGTRVRGGVYAEIPLAKDGVPLDTFLVCPPQPLDAGALRLSPRGVQLIQRPGSEVYDIYDWVGAEHYPNVADIIEEGRRFGFSRRLPRNLDFGKLSRSSRLVLLHHKAVVDNAAALIKAIRSEHAESGGSNRALMHRPCPQHHERHELARIDELPSGETCLRLAYDMVEGGEIVLDPRVPWRTVARTVGDTTYIARRTPDIVVDTRLGIFAILPLTGIAVIDDPDDPEGVAETLRRARKVNGLVVSKEEE